MLFAVVALLGVALMSVPMFADGWHYSVHVWFAGIALLVVGAVGYVWARSWLSRFAAAVVVAALLAAVNPVVLPHVIRDMRLDAATAWQADGEVLRGSGPSEIYSVGTGHDANRVVTARAADDGRVLWRSPALPAGVMSVQPLGPDVVLAALVNSRSAALDARTGEVRWERPLKSRVLAVGGTTAVLTDPLDQSRREYEVTAVSLRDGSTRWSRKVADVMTSVEAGTAPPAVRPCSPTELSTHAGRNGAFLALGGLLTPLCSNHSHLRGHGTDAVFYDTRPIRAASTRTYGLARPSS